MQFENNITKKFSGNFVSRSSCRAETHSSSTFIMQFVLAFSGALFSSTARLDLLNFQMKMQIWSLVTYLSAKQNKNTTKQ